MDNYHTLLANNFTEIDLILSQLTFYFVLTKNTMEFSNFRVDDVYLHQDQAQAQAQYNPHDCWCRGANNILMEMNEMIRDLKSSMRSLIKEEVEEVVSRVILPHFSSTRDSTPSTISAPPQTEPYSSRKLYLRINDSCIPETLFTMNKIRHQVESLTVELLDESGCRVENEPESSTEIMMVVLNGDIEVEDNDLSEEDFKKNIVQPRKYKASSLLKGTCRISLKKGVANVDDISFTDNSMRNGTFRLGAEVVTCASGVTIKAAVSKPFMVKERRLLTDRKHEKPSPEDELWRLKNIRRDGPVYQRAKSENICTVKDFLQLLKTDHNRLRNILDVPETKWKEIVENAEACTLTNDLYKYYDDTGIELVLNCAFDIVSVTFGSQLRQFDESMNDHEKLVVTDARSAAYKNRNNLKLYTPTNQTGSQVGFSCLYRVPSINMQIQAQVSSLPSMSSMFTQDHSAVLVQQGEAVEHAYSYLSGPPSFDQENGESGIYEGQLQDDPEWINQMLELMVTPEAPIQRSPTSKLIAAYYVTKAATMFMVAIKKKDETPLKKKRKFSLK